MTEDAVAREIVDVAFECTLFSVHACSNPSTKYGITRIANSLEE